MSRPAISYIFALFLGSWISGCSSSGMDQAQCQTADWRAVGYEDGSQGRGGTMLGTHRKNCAEHGVTPSFAAYMDGHAQGIREFCRPQNGYRLGTGGYRYNGVCPVELERDFLAAHSDGLGLYQRRAAVDRLHRRISRTKYRSNEVERLLASKTAALVSPLLLPSQRLAIGVELKQLTEERIEIERSLEQLQIDLEQAQNDYQGYRDNLAHR